MVYIYTDGSAKGNPGNGGYGIVMSYNQVVKEFYQGYRLTTNNRMELLAIIVALEKMKTNQYPIHIYSDSKYVIDSITKKWVFDWEKKKYKGKKNSDLWKRYMKLHRQFNLSFHWIKGHDGHKENERCDKLAVLAAEDVRNHLVDDFFESLASSKK